MSDTESLTCDLLVIGSGAAGLSAAVTAAHLGLDAIVIEKETQLGGTSAWSGGWLWIPRNPLAKAAGINEDIEAPRTYLKHELGPHYNAALVDRFLIEGPRMVEFFASQTSLQFIDGNAMPDFHDMTPSAGLGGRSVCAAPFDGRRLGARLNDLRPPLAEISPWGMGIASGADLRHFINATSHWASFKHVAGRTLRHWRDLVTKGRGLHLVNGNALVASLLKSADDLGVRILPGTPAKGLLRNSETVIGAMVERRGKPTEIRAKRGVVLACGGFPHDISRKAAMLPHAPTGNEHWSAAPKTNTGDGLRLGETVGGHVRSDLAGAAALCPVSLVPQPDGSFTHFPHLLERAKPGLIAVLPNGRRFTNEADSYQDMTRGLLAATSPGQAPEAWLIVDHRFIRRYGLGRVRPRPFPIRPWMANGYVKRGRTLAELAEMTGIDGTGLEQTITAYNTCARQGHDPEFHRGESAYNKIQGEPLHSPNPCVAPITDAPFYAVRIVPGSLGTFAGLTTDDRARVLDAENRPISGLYAVGNDMSSMMGGNYPAGGITLGPGMTFGYVAAHHAANVPLDNNRTTKS
jgi:succinate dehydrogenase/fumarate reductase flavoprotein subunit